MTEEGGKAAFVRRHYESLGYRVHSGLQFGCDFVLYADSPEAVHSDFCVYIVPDGKHRHFFLGWFEYCELKGCLADNMLMLSLYQLHLGSNTQNPQTS
jgi:tRNA intron endonuclease, catalytic C-terminal domain